MAFSPGSEAASFKAPRGCQSSGPSGVDLPRATVNTSAKPQGPGSVRRALVGTIIPTWNPMSNLTVALLSFILKVAQMLEAVLKPPQPVRCLPLGLFERPGLHRTMMASKFFTTSKNLSCSCTEDWVQERSTSPWFPSARPTGVLLAW